MTKKHISREELLQKHDLPTREVEVPEWGGVITIRSLTVGQRMQLRSAMRKVEGGKDGKEAFEITDPEAMARILSWGIVDESGKPMFTEADVPNLGEKNPAVILRLVEQIMDLSAMSPAGAEEAKGNLN